MTNILTSGKPTPSVLSYAKPVQQPQPQELVQPQELTEEQRVEQTLGEDVSALGEQTYLYEYGGGFRSGAANVYKTSSGDYYYTTGDMLNKMVISEYGWRYITTPTGGEQMGLANLSKYMSGHTLDELFTGKYDTEMGAQTFFRLFPQYFGLAPPPIQFAVPPTGTVFGSLSEPSPYAIQYQAQLQPNTYYPSTGTYVSPQGTEYALPKNLTTSQVSEMINSPVVGLKYYGTGETLPAYASTNVSQMLGNYYTSYPSMQAPLMFESKQFASQNFAADPSAGEQIGTYMKTGYTYSPMLQDYFKMEPAKEYYHKSDLGNLSNELSSQMLLKERASSLPTRLAYGLYGGLLRTPVTIAAWMSSDTKGRETLAAQEQLHREEWVKGMLEQGPIKGIGVESLTLGGEYLAWTAGGPLLKSLSVPAKAVVAGSLFGMGAISGTKETLEGGAERNLPKFLGGLAILGITAVTGATILESAMRQPKMIETVRKPGEYYPIYGTEESFNRIITKEGSEVVSTGYDYIMGKPTSKPPPLKEFNIIEQNVKKAAGGGQRIVQQEVKMITDKGVEIPREGEMELERIYPKKVAGSFLMQTDVMPTGKMKINVRDFTKIEESHIANVAETGSFTRRIAVERPKEFKPDVMQRPAKINRGLMQGWPNAEKPKIDVLDEMGIRKLPGGLGGVRVTPEGQTVLVSKATKVSEFKPTAMRYDYNPPIVETRMQKVQTNVGSLRGLLSAMFGIRTAQQLRSRTLEKISPINKASQKLANQEKSIQNVGYAPAQTMRTAQTQSQPQLQRMMMSQQEMFMRPQVPSYPQGKIIKTRAAGIPDFNFQDMQNKKQFRLLLDENLISRERTYPILEPEEIEMKMGKFLKGW